MNLENEFEGLVIILGKIKEQYIVYKELLFKQREAIVTNNIEDLTEVLSQLDGINESINRLEARRVYNADALAINAGMEVKTIRDIVKAYPEYDGAKLEKAALELKKEAMEVKRYSTSNAELLEISRNIVKETIKTIMTQDVDPRDRAWRTYGKGGAYSRTVRREPVHIVNKRG